MSPKKSNRWWKKGYIENQLKFDRETARVAAAKMWKESAGGAHFACRGKPCKDRATSELYSGKEPYFRKLD